MTAVKICGVCSAADARVADAAGASYVGVILSPHHKRSQTLKQASPIMEAVDDAQRVGVFVDAPVEELLRARRHLSLDVIQMHGLEKPTDLRAVRDQAGVALWKALRPRSEDELKRLIEEYAGVAHGLLLEGWSPAGAGGTGTRGDWSMAATLRSMAPAGTTFILAGGLDPDNVADAIAIASPDVVDVSSGVESEIGVKSRERIADFIRAAHSAGVS
jgi:phosphoribosylanthranilate isomerase